MSLLSFLRPVQRVIQIATPDAWGGLDAGRVDRTDPDFIPGQRGPNALIEVSNLPRIRARARLLAKNDPNIKAAREAHLNNVVGLGIGSEADTPWPELNEDIDELLEWAGRAVNKDRDTSLAESQRQFYGEVFDGGDVLVHHTMEMCIRDSATMNVMACLAATEDVSILYLISRKEEAQSQVSKRWDPLVKTIPALAERFEEAKADDQRQILLERPYRGGGIDFSAAGSAAAVSSRTYGPIFVDELDQCMANFPSRFGGLHNFVLGRQPSRSVNRQIWMFSHPTLHGQGIDLIFSKFSDLGRWVFDCPHCGEIVDPSYDLVHFRESDEQGKPIPETAELRCARCNACLLYTSAEIADPATPPDQLVEIDAELEEVERQLAIAIKSLETAIAVEADPSSENIFSQAVGIVIPFVPEPYRLPSVLGLSLVGSLIRQWKLRQAGREIARGVQVAAESDAELKKRIHENAGTIRLHQGATARRMVDEAQGKKPARLL